METLRVANLRSLVDTGEIALKPLTLLVGQNAAGKSTFARVLPLLRQGAQTEIAAPVLWWAEGGVDFGTFEQAVRRGRRRGRSCLSSGTRMAIEARTVWFASRGIPSRCA
jgi:predicted ATPase